MENIDYPLVSICLLNYNQKQLLPDVVYTIVNQTYTNYEIIISDDCSTDNSWEVLTALQSKYSKINLYQTPINLGMAKNTNFAVSKANGKYIALLHHDDLVREDLLKKWVEIAEADHNISFVFNDYLIYNYYHINENKIKNKPITWHTRDNCQFLMLMDGKKFLHKNLLKKWSCPVRGTTLFRKDLFLEVGGMDSQFELLADVDLWMKFSAKYKVGYTDEILIFCQQRQQEDYPKEYTAFTWKRINLLHQIHATNIIRLTGKVSLIWIRFKIRVNIEIIKWLGYSVIKRKKFIIQDFIKTNLDYEFTIIKLSRTLLKLILNK